MLLWCRVFEILVRCWCFCFWLVLLCRLVMLVVFLLVVFWWCWFCCLFCVCRLVRGVGSGRGGWKRFEVLLIGV